MQGTILGLRRHIHDSHNSMFLPVCSSSLPHLQSALGATQAFEAHHHTVIFAVC
jgi:hypothetical protein